jgi:hypothetical protein
MTGITNCVAIIQFDKTPVDPCATCARRGASNPHVENEKAKPHKKRTTWTLPPAFWNGTRYVCDKHMEIKNVQY